MNNDIPDDDRTVAQPMPTGPQPPPAPAPAPSARQDSGNALPLGTYLDEFELRSVAGEGGFSIVYRAWDHSLKRQVAVKEYFPSGMVSRSGGTQVVVRSERHPAPCCPVACSAAWFAAASAGAAACQP